MKLFAATALAVLLAWPVQAQETHFRLFVYFSTPAKPEPHQEPGWGSRPVASLLQCEQRRASMTRYLRENAPESVKFTVFCVEFHAHGFDEGLEAFRKQLGILS